MPSGETQPGILIVTQTAAPATSGTALSTVAANTAKTFIDGSGNVLMWDGIIAQALLDTSLANGRRWGRRWPSPQARRGSWRWRTLITCSRRCTSRRRATPIHRHEPAGQRAADESGGERGATALRGAGGDSAAAGESDGAVPRHPLPEQVHGPEIPIILDRYCPQGFMVFLPVSMPFPTPEVCRPSRSGGRRAGLSPLVRAFGPLLSYLLVLWLRCGFWGELRGVLYAKKGKVWSCNPHPPASSFRFVEFFTRRT